MTRAFAAPAIPSAGAFLLGLSAAAAQMPLPPTAAPATSMPPMLTPMVPALTQVQNRLAERLAHVLAAPGELRTLGPELSSWLQSAEGVRTFAFFLILLIVGVGLEWLYWTYAYSALRAVDVTDPVSPRQALFLGLRRLLLKIVGLLVFVLASIGVATSLAWPPGVQDVVLTIVLGVALVRFAALLLRLLLSPGPGSIRLVPLDARAAARANRAVLAVVSLVVVGWLVPDSVERASGADDVTEIIRLATATLAAFIVLAAIAAAGRERRTRRRRSRRLPPFPTLFFASALVLCIYMLWLGGAGRLAFTLAIVCLCLLAEGLLRSAVKVFWPDFGQPGATHVVLPGLTLRLLRLVVAGLSFLAVGVAWDFPVLQMSVSESPAGRLVSHLLGAVALILVADVAWTAIKGAIDSRLRAIGPIEIDGGSPGPNARLVTLLPLLRTAIAAVLATLLALSVLSVLGVEITPLLAGAGVVGIAVGFGAQTLVRDILSGVFYLAEDVFRIGEYIESGASTKGTVERITLRSVALRHHNGPLHFVPYGNLGAVRNNSRDWIIEKFNLPLPIETDSDFVRKLVKGIGQSMLDDPHLGQFMIGPLKAVLYRIDPGVKIFRCKIQTHPGKQFEVRAAAYKRIEAALKQAGIPFAENASRLVVHEGLGKPELAAMKAGQA